MARTARVKSETRTYHILVRGKNGQALFLDEEDYCRFLEILQVKGAGRDFVLYAYCLMRNHAHLVIREGAVELASIMKRINIAYAYYFNHKYQRSGPVFHDRFKSEAIKYDTQFLSMIRHIHRTPEKAGIADRAETEEYRWSSSSYFLKRNVISSVPIDRDYVLYKFWPELNRARQLFERFSRQPDDRKFLSFPVIASPLEAKEMVTTRCREQGIDLSNLKDRKYTGLRSEMITKLKQETWLSVRQIAELLGVGRSIVRRNK